MLATGQSWEARSLQAPRAATLQLRGSKAFQQGQQVQQQRRSKRSHAANTIEARTKAPTVQYICKDCGWIYDGRQSFESLDKSYRCPVCNSPKRRFAVNKESNKGVKGSSSGSSGGDLNPAIVIGAGGLLAMGAIFYALSQA